MTADGVFLVREGFQAPFEPGIPRLTAPQRGPERSSHVLCVGELGERSVVGRVEKRERFDLPTGKPVVAADVVFVPIDGRVDGVDLHIMNQRDGERTE